MQSIKHTLTLDTLTQHSGKSVTVKRGDTARVLCILLLENGKPYRIASDCRAVFTAKKPDDTVICNDCEIAGNIIFYSLTEQTVAAQGIFPCEIKLYGKDDLVLTCADFTLVVEPTVYSEKELVASAPEANALMELVLDARSAIEELETAWQGGAFNGKEGVGISKITQTAASNENGGKNILAITRTDGAVSEFTVYNGTQGEKGETGTTQLVPVFANNADECTDTDKLYVLPDGYIYAHMNKELSEQVTTTQPIEFSIGVKIDSSTGTETTGNTTYAASAYYSMQENDSYIIQTTMSNADIKICYYDSDRRFLTCTSYNLMSMENGEKTATVPYYTNACYFRLRAFHGAVSAELFTPYSLTCIRQQTVVRSGFFSTGHAFVPCDYEDRILAAEESISLLEKQTSADNKGAAYPSAYDIKVAECIQKIRALHRQGGKACVTFPFFSDNHHSLGYTGALIRAVMDACAIPYCFYGGDAISADYIPSEDALFGQAEDFAAMMKALPRGSFCPAIGNHDGAWSPSYGVGYRCTDKAIYDLFIRQSLCENRVYGKEGLYYYIDEPNAKVRFIVLDSNRGYQGAAAFGEEQRTWLKNTALTFREPGWTAVFFSHAPITNNFHSAIEDAVQVQAILCDYLETSDENKAEIAGWFAGHIHRDRIYACDHTAAPDADDTVTCTLPFKTVTVTSDANLPYDKSEPIRDPKTGTAHAIDFVTLDMQTKTVYLTRLGVGSDRSYTYGVST